MRSLRVIPGSCFVIPGLTRDPTRNCHPGEKRCGTITPQGESRGQACLSMTEPLAELSEGQLTPQGERKWLSVIGFQLLVE